MYLLLSISKWKQGCDVHSYSFRSYRGGVLVLRVRLDQGALLFGLCVRHRFCWVVVWLLYYYVSQDCAVSFVRLYGDGVVLFLTIFRNVSCLSSRKGPAGCHGVYEIVVELRNNIFVRVFCLSGPLGVMYDVVYEKCYGPGKSEGVLRWKSTVN